MIIRYSKADPKQNLQKKNEVDKIKNEVIKGGGWKLKCWKMMGLNGK